MPARQTSLPSSSKKRKTREDDTVRTIQDLEKQLTAAVSSGSSLNSLADLLDIALEAESAAQVSKAIYALYRVFVVIITRGLLSGPDASEEAKAVRTWLLDRLHAFVDFLSGLLKDEEPSLKVCSEGRTVTSNALTLCCLYRSLLWISFSPFRSTYPPP